MSATEAWQEHIADEPHWYERRYPEVKDGFMAGYVRALEDAADAVEDVRTNGLPIGTQSAPYGRHIEQWLRALAAAADPRETKD